MTRTLTAPCSLLLLALLCVSRALGLSPSDNWRINPALRTRDAPFPVATNTTRFVLCTIHKNSSSRWRLLIMRAMDLAGVYKTEFSKLNNYDMIFPSLNGPEYGRAFFDAVPSIVIVRNPYVRFLSYFYNKIIVDNKPGNFPRSYRPGPNQARTIMGVLKAMQRDKEQKRKCNPHFCPQVTHCGFQSGLKYTVLKLEDMNVWYGPLIKQLNLTDYIEDGWNFGTTDLHEQCFFKPLGFTCESFKRAGYPSVAAPPSGTVRCFTETGNHSTCATSKLNSLTKEDVAMLNDYYREDFAAFGYDMIDPEDFSKNLPDVTLTYPGKNQATATM